MVLLGMSISVRELNGLVPDNYGGGRRGGCDVMTMSPKAAAFTVAANELLCQTPPAAPGDR